MSEHRCPVCDNPHLETVEMCPVCGWDLSPVAVGSAEEYETWLEAPRAAWRESVRRERVRREKAGNWVGFQHELTYKVKVQSASSNEEAKLTLHFTTRFAPPLRLPRTVLIGNEGRLPTLLGDGVPLVHWPPVLVGADGGLLTAPLSILGGKTWFVRLFMEETHDAERIRLIHGRTDEMRIAGVD
jgi:hypothetical protein